MTGWYVDILWNTPRAYSSLPAASVVPGAVAAINDGKAANCADGTCTTFGTVVSAGGGALPLLLWSNGMNWTLIGK